MSRDWDKETGESQETHSFSYQSKHRVKGIRKGDFTSRAQNVTGEGRGREGRWWADLVLQIKSTSMHDEFGKDSAVLGLADEGRMGRLH